MIRSIKIYESTGVDPHRNIAIEKFLYPLSVAE